MTFEMHPRAILEDLEKWEQYHEEIPKSFKWSSMSTRHIGHLLFVVNHWSTHSIWNKCMHGSLLHKEKENLDSWIKYFVNILC